MLEEMKPHAPLQGDARGNGVSSSFAPYNATAPGASGFDALAVYRAKLAALRAFAAANRWVLSGRRFTPAQIGTRRCGQPPDRCVGFTAGRRRGVNQALLVPPGADWGLVAARHGLAVSVPPKPLAGLGALLHLPGHAVRWLREQE